jgi:hypothetical protein
MTEFKEIKVDGEKPTQIRDLLYRISNSNIETFATFMSKSDDNEFSIKKNKNDAENVDELLITRLLNTLEKVEILEKKFWKEFFCSEFLTKKRLIRK